MATPTLFFYDLETSGIHPDSARIMQFAGQRVDAKLEKIGEPINYLIRLSEDVLPEPQAILIHGIAPQQTVLEGLSEAEFLREFYESVVTADTTFVGFNNVRFDDEFIRFLNYRNLYDPYAWAWENNRSRWDLLDVVRMIQALKPEGINWPIDKTGKPTNRLELLAKENKLTHISAHDALSDVEATIELAKLIKQKQPSLYDYLFSVRLKDKAAKLVNSRQPFIYTSSHYPSTNLHTTLAVKVADNLSAPNSVLVYDLRFDPKPWLNLSPAELADAWRFTKERNFKENPPLPIKTLRTNRCPAIAPAETIGSDPATLKRLSLDLKQVEKHLKQLNDAGSLQFANRLNQALEILNAEQSERYLSRKPRPDAQLYDGFYNDNDRKLLRVLHEKGENAERVRSLREKFSDHRLSQLCSFYLSRNYKRELTAKEREGWEKYLNRYLLEGGDGSRLALYFKQIADLAQERTDTRSQVLLEDLKLYGESLIPASYTWD
ncbi:MAG: exodeoxyribonuclease I [Candidatus Saccharimonadales bacterium]